MSKEDDEITQDASREDICAAYHQIKAQNVSLRSALEDSEFIHTTGALHKKLRTRLTQADVVEIFLRKQSQKSPTVVSRLCGVSEKTVRDIWSGRTWSKETQHLDPSRTMCIKKIGRPTGRKDTKPRKPRTKLIALKIGGGREGLTSDGGREGLKQRSDRADSMYGTRSMSKSVSIDEQLDDWYQNGCWIDAKGLSRFALSLTNSQIGHVEMK